MSMSTNADRLSLLRKEIKARNLSGFIIPCNDEYQSEFVPAIYRRLEWLTGFSGSAGAALVLQDGAAFFTDGRYTLQAEEQVSQDYQHFNIADKSPKTWAAEHVSGESKLGFDPWLLTESQVKEYEQTGIGLESSPNLIDVIWQDKPQDKAAPIKMHLLEYAGRSAQDKINDLVTTLKKRELDAVVLTAPDSICWLLNIRGADTPNSPVVLCYAIVHADGMVDVFLETEKVGAEIQEEMASYARFFSMHALDDILIDTMRKSQAIQIDPDTAAYWFFEQLQTHEVKVVRAKDPCLLPKACKNEIEVDGAKQAHLIDGAAVTAFLHWLDKHPDIHSLSEMEAAQQLEEFRKQNEAYLEPSFDTISGFAANGAIVHYRVSEESNKKFDGDGLYLVDSGGQYLTGTTDITRTVAIGTPSEEEKSMFTKVLKGHIALACAVFPEGTTGSQVDALARQFLWQAGFDYDHGTGHGVGSYLHVHEGPQRISKMPNKTALQPGMIISNEPGFYKEGAFGIRIESLVVVVEKPELSKEGKTFYGFETITKAPLDPKLINLDELTDAEIAWLRSYHQRVQEDLDPLLGEEASSWLAAISF